MLRTWSRNYTQAVGFTISLRADECGSQGGYWRRGWWIGAPRRQAPLSHRYGMYSGKIFMSDAFNKALSIAYGNEYNMPNIVIFSNSWFRWCKKLSFSDPLASTIYVQNGRLQVQSNQMVRIDHIYVHRYEGVGRLFIKATPIDSQQPATEDPVLGSGYWCLWLATSSEETILLYGLCELGVTQYTCPTKIACKPKLTLRPAQHPGNC